MWGLGFIYWNKGLWGKWGGKFRVCLGGYRVILNLGGGGCCMFVLGCLLVGCFCFLDVLYLREVENVWVLEIKVFLFMMLCDILCNYLVLFC